LVVLAGSSDYLVYADYPVPTRGHPDFAHGEIHVQSLTGADRNLGTGFGSDPANPGAYRFSVIGTTLTASSPFDPTHVSWWNLAAHTYGIGTLPSGARWQGSALNGWVFVEPDNATLTVETTAGVLTSYGQPLPSTASLAGPIKAISGPGGVVTISEPTGAIAYERWGSPSQIVPLDLGASADSAGLSCNDISGSTVGCVDRGADGLGTTELAVHLDGSAPVSYSGCGADPVAFGPQLVWVCGRRVSRPRFSAKGTNFKRSAVPVAPLEGVSALNAFVTVGPRQEAILGIATSTSPSRVLVAIPAPIVRADNTNLRAAASAVMAQALHSGALTAPPPYQFPAQVLQASADALIRAARAQDPSLTPMDTRAVMGPVPPNVRHHSHPRPRHRHVKATHSLARFSHALPDSGSGGIGTRRTHGGSAPAPFQRRDGVYVEPRLPRPASPTISMVALRAALKKLGQPYVWAAAGPRTFDCSGLVQWAYAHAVLRFTHFSGAQWNEGRLIKPSQILPGDLILFDHLINHHQVIHHVGIYLGAGWMVNAPFTGQYVNIVRVPSGIAGIVRP